MYTRQKLDVSTIIGVGTGGRGGGGGGGGWWAMAHPMFDPRDLLLLWNFCSAAIDNYLLQSDWSEHGCYS